MMNNLKNKSNVKCQNTFGFLDQWIYAEGRDCETCAEDGDHETGVWSMALWWLCISCSDETGNFYFFSKFDLKSQG